MARKRNDNKFRSPATRANNRRGPRSVNFDDDYPMGGLDPPTTKGRHSSKRRSQNNYNPPRGRSQSPYRGSNRKNNRAPSFSQDQHSRNNHNPHHGAQGYRTNSHNNSNPNTKHNRRRHPRAASTDNADAEFDENTSIDDPFNSSFFSPRHIHNGVYKSKNSNNNNIRSCTECSSVRRANLRFRNWAVRALSRCNERFAAWANEVGVGFGTGDEMDWQPEPVVRVLLVGGDMSPTSTASTTSLPPISLSTGTGGQQRQQQQQEEQIGPVPKPGPWVWPPWSASAGCHPPEALPAQPQDGGLATSQENMPCGGIYGGDGNGTLPISGFGLLGVSCGEVSGPLSNLNPNVGLNQWSIRDQGRAGEVEDD
ncbi:uncharacterized protein F4817DRAFT_59037 [Daldinia loculata]|uniref:uncharacterized protein n=1 Tax=Daldinia loculata TaxID=103429 RepID=UPI0020C42CFA|nr:uncharacterized protein F4817DRAFT_59037 [Daldinia loculata]KAI1648588.1 hypothetical protein F4817DRAFT_59037 [Daldinia loculata]